MPRPKRDYGVALRQDIAKLDDRIESLVEERARKRRMLDAYESDIPRSELQLPDGGSRRGRRPGKRGVKRS